MYSYVYYRVSFKHAAQQLEIFLAYLTFNPYVWIMFVSVVCPLLTQTTHDQDQLHFQTVTVMVKHLIFHSQWSLSYALREDIPIRRYW